MLGTERNMKFSMLLFLTMFQAVNSQLIFREDFETGSFKEQWKTHLDGNSAIVEVVNNPTRKGQYAVRMKTSERGKDRRAELVPFIDRFKWGEEIWIGFSMLIKTPSGKAGIVHQHHSIPNNRNWKNCIAGPNSFTIRARDHHNLEFLTATDDDSLNKKPPKGAATLYQESTIVKYSTNKWLDIVYHFKYADNENGFFQCWVNGKKIINDKGPNVYRYDVCGELKIKEQYLKIGLYPAAQGADGEVFYDEISIAGKNATFNDVSPSK